MAFKLRKYTCGMIVYTITVVLLSASPELSANEGVEISFGLYTSDKPTSLVKKFRPILNTLEKSLSRKLKKEVKIKLSIARTYHAGIQALVDGKVDFARFGPASYIIAHNKNPGIRLLAMETKNGKKHFHGVISVRQDSPIRKITDLKGRSFAFGSERSTIGRYLSQQHLLHHGIRAHDLSNYKYLGRHDKVGYAIAHGKYDAGALKQSTLKKLIKKGQPLRVLAKFNNVTKPWVARKGLPVKIQTALTDALLNTHDKKALAAIKKDGFTTATHKAYLAIEQAIKNNPEFFK